METDLKPTTDSGDQTAEAARQHRSTDKARGDARPTLRLGPLDKTPAEKRSFRQIEQAQREHQAHIGLEAEVRTVARELGLERARAEELAKASWGAFRMVNGEPIPVQADQQTVVLGADGNVLRVSEWVARQANGQPRGEDGRWTMADGNQGSDTSPNPLPGRGGEGESEELLPRRNPFRRKTWNLTEQMRLTKRDPKLARRLKAEAWAEGEN